MQKKTKKVVATAMLGLAGVALTPSALHQVNAKASTEAETASKADNTAKNKATAKVTVKSQERQLKAVGAVDDKGYLTKDAAQDILTNAVKKGEKSGDVTNTNKQALDQVKNSVSQETFNELFPAVNDGKITVNKKNNAEVIPVQASVGSNPELKADAQQQALKLFDNNVKAATIHQYGKFPHGIAIIAKNSAGTVVDRAVYWNYVIDGSYVHTVFCIEMGQPWGTFNVSKGTSAATKYVSGNKDLVNKLGAIEYFGWGTSADHSAHNYNDAEWYIATQFEVWKAIGRYKSGGAYHSLGSSPAFAIQEGASANSSMKQADVRKKRTALMKKVTAFMKNVSWNKKTVSITKAGTYTETDSNKVTDSIKGDQSKLPSGLSAKLDKTGNKLNIKVTDAFVKKYAGKTVTVTWNKTKQDKGYMKYYVGSGAQATSTFDGNFNNQQSIKIKIGKQSTPKPDSKYGPIIFHTKKTDRETGKVIPGTVFQICDGDGNPVTKGYEGKELPNGGQITTGADGIATTPELEGGDPEYTLKEVSVPAPYILNAGEHEGLLTDSISADGNELTVTKDPDTGKETITGDTSPVDAGYVKEPEYGMVNGGKGFTNLQARGQIRVQKRDATTGSETEGDGTFAGAVFHVQQQTDYWGNVPETPDSEDITTGEDGDALTSEDLHLGTYLVTETKAPKGYRLDSTPATVKINYKDQYSPVVYPEDFPNDQIVTMNNHIGATRLIIDKTEAEEDDGSGNLTSGKIKPLAGIHFIISRVNKGENNGVIRYAANTNATDDAFIKEHPPVEGSTLPDGKDHDQLEVITDKDGFARLDFLPYGEYNIHEVPDHKHQAMKDYHIFLGNPSGQTIDSNDWLNSTTSDTLDDRDEMADVEHITNYPIATMLKIVKVDAESEKEYPVLDPNAIFEIVDEDTGKLYAPEVWDDDTAQTEAKTRFHTNKDGYLILPKQLKKNDKGYTIREVQAPEGYKLNPATIHFDVPEDSQAGKENAITVKQSDTSQKGKIRVVKSGETVTGVEEATDKATGIKYNKFTYGKSPLANAKFNVIAAENIIKKDGEMMATKGEVVDTITTNSKGHATTKDLELGKYKIKEVSAPAGYTYDKDQEYDVELTYDQQLATANKDLPTQDKKIDNDLQELNLNILKQGEQLTDYVNSGKGFNTVNKPLANITFGIYNQEDIKDASGKVILPKDSVVGVSTTGADGVANFKEKFPKLHFYAKELKTDSSHVLSDGKYGFEYNPYNNDASQSLYVGGNGVSTDKENNLKPIENKLYRGRFEIKKLAEKMTIKDDKPTYKVIEDGKIVKGTEFTLKDAKGKLVQKLVIGDDSRAKSNELAVGTYKLTETKAPSDKYKLDTTVYTVKVTKDGTTVKSDGKNIYGGTTDIEAFNHKSDASEKATALHAKFEGNTLPVNASYVDSIFGTKEADTSKDDSNTSDETNSDDKNTGENVDPSVNGEGGDTNQEAQATNAKARDYTPGEQPDNNGESESNDTDDGLNEDHSNDKNDSDTDTPVDDDSDATEAQPGKVATQEMGNYGGLLATSKVKDLKDAKASVGANPVYEAFQNKTKDTVKVYTFKNYLKKGDLVFKKTSVTGTDELPGAHIHIKGPGVDINFVSKKTPTEFKLPEGSYTFTETKAPKGYQRSTETGYFKIQADKVTKCRLKDKPNKPLPKTGSNIAKGIGGFVALLMATLGTMVGINKRRKNDTD